MNASDESNLPENELEQLEIEFSNLRSVELFGVDKTELSVVQLILPQFLPLDGSKFYTQEALQDVKRLDKLRKAINTEVWTG